VYSLVNPLYKTKKRLARIIERIYSENVIKETN
jgi:hypothetical protein